MEGSFCEERGLASPALGLKPVTPCLSHVYYICSLKPHSGPIVPPAPGPGGLRPRGPPPPSPVCTSSRWGFLCHCWPPWGWGPLGGGGRGVGTLTAWHGGG